LKNNPILLDQQTWDVIVIGGGPSGLFAALGVALTSRYKVLLIDAGKDIYERSSSNISNLITQNLENKTDYLRGIGGAGLFSDGKLTFSLRAGGNLYSILNSEQEVRLLKVIIESFGLFLDFTDFEPANENEIIAAKKEANQIGLDYTYHPVLGIGTDRCKNIIAQVKNTLVELGVKIVSNCELTDLLITKERNTKIAHVESQGCEYKIESKNVVLCMGKSGSKFQSDLCQKLGSKISPRPMYIGMRLESDEDAIKELFKLSKDPKLSEFFSDNSKIKTHCASDGGEIIKLTYDGLPLVGGHNFHQVDRTRRSGRSGFSILWNGIQIDDEPYLLARKIMEEINQFTNGNLLIQTLGDFVENIASTRENIAKINISNKFCTPGNIREFLPVNFVEKSMSFILKISKIVPRILGDSTVLYAPSIEWWMNNIEIVNNYMETSNQGIYACGDGSGWSQGIVHSAATGILAAEGITGVELTANLILKKLSLRSIA
jgi:uncharacterized protein